MAEVGALRINLSLDSANFTQGMQQINRKLRGLTSEFKAVTAGNKDFENSLEGIRTKSQYLTNVLSLQKSRVETLKREYEQMKRLKGEDAKETENLAIRYNKALAAMNRTEQELKEVNNQLEKQSSILNRMQTKLTGFGERMQDLGGRMQTAGQDIATSFGAATAAIGAGLGLAAKKAMDFEAQMSSVKSVMSPEEAQRYNQALEELAITMGAKTKYSALEAAQGIEELVKAGVSVEAILEGGLEGALSLATAGSLDLASAAEIASTALNAFSADGLSVGKAADILAGAANASATSVDEMKYSLSAVSAVASGVGLSFADTSAALASMAMNGLKGSDAGTSLKTMLMNLTPKTKEQYEAFSSLNLISYNTQKAIDFLTAEGVKPLSNEFKDVNKAFESYILKATGSKKWNDKATKAYRELGQEIGFLSSSFYDAQGNIRGMDEIAGALQNSLKGLNNEQRQTKLYEMFGSDAIRAGNILFKEGAKGIEDMAAAMGKVKAADVAAERMNNLKGKMEELKGAFETGLISLGDALLPIITKVVAGLQKLVDKFNSLSPGMQKFIAIGGLVAAVMTGIVAAIGIAIAIAGSAVTGFGALMTTMGGAAGVAGTFSSAMAVITGPIGIAVAAIAGLVVAFVALYKKNEEFRNKVNEIWASIKTAFSSALKFIKGIVVNVMSSVMSFFKGVLSQIRGFWNENGKQIMAIVKAFMGFIGGYIKSSMLIIKGIFQAIWPVISGIVKVAWGIIQAATKTTLSIVLGTIQFFLKLFKGDWKGAFNTIKSTTSNILKNIVSIFKSINLKNIGKDIIRGLIDGISSMAGAITAKVKSLAGLVPKSMKKMLGIASPSKVMAKEVGQWIPEGVAQGISKNIKSVTKASDKMVNATIPNVNNQDNSRTYQPSIVIQAPPSANPSELARKALQTQRQLAMEWGY